MMKQIFLAILGAAFLWTACSEDKGNYDYHDINEVKVTGVEEGKWYTKVAFVDNLTFDPQIESTIGKNGDENYEFTWKILPQGDDFSNIEDIEKCTVSHERKLDLHLTLDPGDYSGFFIVKDKATEVSWTTSFYLRIRSMTSEGWLLLCEKEGDSRMDIIFNVDAEQDLVARDIWAEEEFRPGKPKRLIFNYYTDETVTLLVTDKSTYNLDASDLHVGEDNDLKYRFGVTPESVHVLASAISQFSVTKQWIIVDGQNDVYMLNKSTNNAVFEFPANKLDGKTDFKAAPFVGVSYNNVYVGGYGCAPAVLYDATGRQFVQIRNNSYYPSLMTFTGRQLFQPQTGRDMVYMESTKPGLIYALLRDPSTRQLYFYGMKLSATYEEPENWWEEGDYEEFNTQEYYGEVKGEGTADATLFACHHTYPFLFYVKGHSIFQFDMGHPDEPAQEVLSFPEEEITVVKFVPFTAWEAYQDWERVRNYRLIVGTVDNAKPEAECGTVRMYDVPNLMEPLVKVKEYTGMGKIVDIVYKERKK